jgi:hypothetical protein
MEWKDQEPCPSAFVGVQVIKDLKQMDKVCDSPVTQFIHQTDVRYTSKPGIMEIDGTVHREDFASKQVGTIFPLIETWEIMVLSSLLHVKRCSTAWVSLSAHPLSLGVQIISPQSSFSPRYSLFFSPCSPPRFCLARSQKAQLVLSPL